MAKQWARQDWIGLGIVIIVAALMRLMLPGVVEFKHDEAYLSLLAQDALANGQLPLVGMPSSVGIPNAPASVWLLMLPYAVTNNPLVATLFVALLNVGGVAVLYLLARDMLGREAALAAGVLYAVNPWAVLYSRKLWAQDMHTPFILLGLWLGWRGFTRGGRVMQALSLPVLVFGLQMHYAAWFLLPLWAGLLVIGRRQIRWGAVAVSVVLAAGVILPFGIGIYDAWQTDPALFGGAVAGDETALQVTAKALTDHGRLATGVGLVPEVVGAADVLPDVQQLALFPAVLLGGLMAVGAAHGLMAYRRATVFVLAWLALTVLAFSLTWTDFFIHYAITSLPALCWLGGLGIGAVSEWFGRANTSPAALRRGLLGVIGGVQALIWLQVLLQVSSVYSPAFGTPLGDKLAAKQALDGATDAVLVSDGYRVRLDEEAAAWSVMLRGEACLRVTDGGAYRVRPAAPFTLLAEPDAADGALPEGDPTHVIPVAQSTERAYRVYPQQPADDDRLLAVEPVQFESGVTLTGADIAGTIMLLEWEMPDAQPGLDLQYFAHFMDADGERVAQRDGDFIPGRFWCAGDTVRTLITVDVPPDAETMRVGLYALDDERGFVNQNVLGPDGAVIGTAGTLPLP